MKKIVAIIITVLFLVSLITVSVYASDSNAPNMEDEIIYDDTFFLEENSVLDGNIVAINSIVIIKENSIITGDIVMINSSINIDAEVNGSLIAFGGVVNLFENTVIHGDLITPGAATHRTIGAEVYGQVVTSELSDLQDTEYFDDIESIIDGIKLSDQLDNANFFGNTFQQNTVLSPIARILWIIFSSFIVSVMSVFVVLLFRKRTQLITKTIKENLMESGGFGLVTLIVVFPILTVIFLILGITIILLPVTLLVFIVMALTSFIGWVMTCIEIGKIITTAFKWEWSDAVLAGIGTFIMTLVIMGVNLIFWDIFGLLLGLIVSSLGVGSLLLTRFGSIEYKRKSGLETAVSE